ncbi:MAG TPA: hypothetical protein VNA04_18650 [Thermoanaerobaculia bacterium]|nr:hypothetical protein [Thermoanaerobaculia bacterium]
MRPDQVWPWLVQMGELPRGGSCSDLRKASRTERPVGRSCVLLYALVDPGQFLMERKWLLGLKERAERKDER